MQLWCCGIRYYIAGCEQGSGAYFVAPMRAVAMEESRRLRYFCVLRL